MHSHILFRYQISSFPVCANASRSASIASVGHFSGQADRPSASRMGMRVARNPNCSAPASTRSTMQRSPRLFPIRKMRELCPRKYTSDRNQSQSVSVTVSLRASSSSCGSSMMTRSGRFEPHESPRTAAPFPYASMRTRWPERYCTSSARPESSTTFSTSARIASDPVSSRLHSWSFFDAVRCVEQMTTRYDAAAGRPARAGGSPG